MRPPTSAEKIKYCRRDATLVGFDQREGWSGELPFYKFKCRIHGEVIDYEHGWYKTLSCPYC